MEERIYKSHRQLVLDGSSVPVKETLFCPRVVRFVPTTITDTSGNVSVHYERKTQNPLQEFDAFKFTDFSIESLSQSGAIANLQLITLSNPALSESSIDSFLNAVEKLDVEPSK